ncbi:MAG: hypothetical protein LBJ20_00420 [Candidatus Methanoplasma sp.]|jgi:hypothetical protein|nr:hypothetical protein [Candidatus Methanoplasma sp.]
MCWRTVAGPNNAVSGTGKELNLALWKANALGSVISQESARLYMGLAKHLLGGL